MLQIPTSKNGNTIIIPEYDADQVLFMIDYDDTLEPSTQRNLKNWQRQALWMLHHHTGGNSIVFTNSDRRTIEPVLNGYPCIAEHGSVFRLQQDGEITYNAPDIKTPELAIRAIDLITQAGLFKPTFNAHELHMGGYLKVEAKERSFCIVHETVGERGLIAKTYSGEVVRQIYNEFNLAATHEIVIGKDAVEIKPNGLSKKTALDAVMSMQRYQNQQIILFEDSNQGLLEYAHETYGAHCVGVGHGLTDGAYLTKRFNDMDQLWMSLDRAACGLAYNRKFTL